MPKNNLVKLPINQLDTSVFARAKYERSCNITELSTRQKLLLGTQRFNNYLVKRKLKVTPESISSYLEMLKKEQAPATWNSSRIHLKKALKLQPQIGDNYFFKTVVEEIFRDIKPVTLDKRVNDYLSRKQIDKLIKGSSIRLGLMLRFLFMTGCRISEMISIRLRDIRLGEVITIRLVGKGSKQRSVFISPELYNSIRDEFCGTVWLFETAKGSKYNRSVIWRQLKRSGTKILGKDIHPHMIRHSTANYLLHEKKKSARYISEVLGHSSPAVTLEMYIHEKPQEDITTLFA